MSITQVIWEALDRVQKTYIRAKEKTEASNWYPSLFSWSPWLTALSPLTAIAETTLLLLLSIMIGPCIF